MTLYNLNLPSSIAAGPDSSTLYYGAFRKRCKQIAGSGGVTETTLYVGGILERVTRGGVTEFRHLICAGTGTVAIYTRRSSGTPATDTYYVHRDHQGSPELVTNAAGVAVTRLSFSAYGARRDSTDWSGPISRGQASVIAGITQRGYTDHEHLDAVALLHMNGRVYEPLIGRFLSRDPMLLIGSQGPNGYGYVQNNPMSLVDPTGYRSRPIEPRVLETGPSAVVVTCAPQLLDHANAGASRYS